MSQLEALLNGINHLEPVDLSPWGGPDRVWLRPLSGPEAGRVDAIRLAALKSQVSLEGQSAQAHPIIEDMGAFLEKQREGRIFAVSCALSHSGETCALDQAGRLPATWTEALADVVFRISGLESADDSFRGAPGMDGVGADGGIGDVAAVSGRNAGGGVPGRVDAPPA